MTYVRGWLAEILRESQEKIAQKQPWELSHDYRVEIAKLREKARAMRDVVIGGFEMQQYNREREWRGRVANFFSANGTDLDEATVEYRIKPAVVRAIWRSAFWWLSP